MNIAVEETAKMYKIGSEKTIVLSSEVKEKFEQYRIKLPRKESGGILLGQLCINDCIIVNEITEPSQMDNAGYFFFERDKTTAQKIIKERWKRSDGKQIYLGEWHTHNEPNPKPSRQDKKMIFYLLQASKMEIDFLITIIVGINSYYVGLQTNKELQSLKISNNPFVYNIRK